MKFPLLFAGVNISEMQEFGEELKAILNKSLRSFANMIFNFFADLMKVIEFITNNSKEISYRFKVILAIVVYLLNLNSQISTKRKWNYLIQGVFITL